MRRPRIPMTKFAVRAVTLALLDLGPNDVLVDVGAGTGAIAVQAAVQGATVYAIERRAEAVELIRANAAQFGVDVDVRHDAAPDALAHIPAFTRCFIGGSGGQLATILAAVQAKLRPAGVIAANFIILRNLLACQEWLAAHQFRQIETRLLQTATMDDRGMLRGNNPVGVIKGVKQP